MAHFYIPPPRVIFMPPSAYFGKDVKVLRSCNANARNQTGTVTIHNTERGTLCVETDNGQAVWTHVNNVEILKGETNGTLSK